MLADRSHDRGDGPVCSGCDGVREALDLRALGLLQITRASQVEPDEAGAWWADLSPVGGMPLGPFSCRSEALEAEVRWLTRNWLTQNELTQNEPELHLTPKECE